MPRFHLPDVADLLRLGEPREYAITIYAETAPGPDQRDTGHVTAKSAFDRAIRELREHGVPPDVEQRLRLQWQQISESELWLQLSRSLAIFIADDFHEVYVLPNALVTASQVGTYFDIGQLMRAVTTPQEAFALTLSGNGWNLWRATATTRAEELPLVGEHPVDVADATNRATVRDRDHVRRLVGDEGKKLLLETYAKRVADAVAAELGRIDPAAKTPLFVFATEPLLGLFRGLEHRYDTVPVPGAPDELRPDQIDDAIRTSLAEVNAARTSAVADKAGDGVARGLAATDLADIGRAAVAGAVSTLIYDFTGDVLGHLDDGTGQVTLDDGGYDLVSRIALTVLDKGGDVIAVRPGEVDADIWNGTALASLRYALT